MKETKTKGLILLIDDDPDTVRLIGTLLEKEGYTTTSALNGKQGLRKVYEENPDLILIDIKLPDIDGNEVLKNIKETNPDRPVIMMTAYADIDNAILALKLGADDYIKKPFDNTHLTHTINRTYEAMTLRKEKKILKQRVTKLLKKKLKLTHNDKLTLYGLAQHPNASDITLSKKLGIPRTTITGIKNKLRKKQFYRKINTPNLPKLGCELLTISYIKFNPHGIINERKTHTQKILKQPELIYAQSTDTEEILIHASGSYTDFKKNIDAILKTYTDNNYLENINTYQFPYKLSTIPRFLDYAPLLHNLFNLKIKHKTRKEPPTEKNHETTNTEKTILYALTKYPQSSDTEIAKKVSLSRARVSQVKTKLLKEKLIQSTIIPDLKKIGCELLAIEHTQTRGKTTTEIDPKTIFIAEGEIEAIKISALEDYTEYKIIYEKKARAYNKNTTIKPQTSLIPTENIKISKLEFSPLVKKILRLDVKF